MCFVLTSPGIRYTTVDFKILVVFQRNPKEEAQCVINGKVYVLRPQRRKVDIYHIVSHSSQFTSAYLLAAGGT